jgi:hypothetical protein
MDSGIEMNSGRPQKGLALNQNFVSNRIAFVAAYSDYSPRVRAFTVRRNHLGPPLGFRNSYATRKANAALVRTVRRFYRRSRELLGKNTQHLRGFPG